MGRKLLPFQSDEGCNDKISSILMSPEIGTAVPGYSQQQHSRHCGISHIPQWHCGILSHSPVLTGLWGSPGTDQGCSVSHSTSLGSLGLSDR